MKRIKLKIGKKYALKMGFVVEITEMNTVKNKQTGEVRNTFLAKCVNGTLPEEENLFWNKYGVLLNTRYAKTFHDRVTLEMLDIIGEVK